MSNSDEKPTNTDPTETSAILNDQKLEFKAKSKRNQKTTKKKKRIKNHKLGYSKVRLLAPEASTPHQEVPNRPPTSSEDPNYEAEPVLGMSYKEKEKNLRKLFQMHGMDSATGKNLYALFGNRYKQYASAGLPALTKSSKKSKKRISGKSGSKNGLAKSDLHPRTRRALMGHGYRGRMGGSAVHNSNSKKFKNFDNYENGSIFDDQDHQLQARSQFLSYNDQERMFGVVPDEDGYLDDGRHVGKLAYHNHFSNFRENLKKRWNGQITRLDPLKPLRMARMAQAKKKELELKNRQKIRNRGWVRAPRGGLGARLAQNGKRGFQNGQNRGFGGRHHHSLGVSKKRIRDKRRLLEQQEREAVGLDLFQTPQNGSKAQKKSNWMKIDMVPRKKRRAEILLEIKEMKLQMKREASKSRSIDRKKVIKDLQKKCEFSVDKELSRRHHLSESQHKKIQRALDSSKRTIAKKRNYFLVPLPPLTEKEKWEADLDPSMAPNLAKLNKLFDEVVREIEERQEYLGKIEGLGGMDGARKRVKGEILGRVSELDRINRLIKEERRELEGKEQDQVQEVLRRGDGVSLDRVVNLGGGGRYGGALRV